MRRKIKLSTLEELSGVISHDEMVHYSGGGDGTRNDPYTFLEYKALGEAFQKGWVQLSDDNISYLTENYHSYYCSNYYGSTNNWGDLWGGNSNCYHGSSAAPYNGGYTYYYDKNGHYIEHKPSSGNYIAIGNAQMSFNGNIEGLEPKSSSGVKFSGEGVTPELYAFITANTEVEWCYLFDSGKSGGVMMTTHQEHQVSLGSGDWSKYENIVHNHSRIIEGLSKDELIEINNLPSNYDVQMLELLNRDSGKIYNELTGTYHDYDKGTTTQETWLQNNGYERVY